MQRHIYRFFTMLLLFAGAMVVMVGHLEEITFHREMVTDMAEASFPTLYLLNREREMNPLYGYGANMDASDLRESLTPLDTEQFFHVVIEEHGSRVKRMLYELWDAKGTTMVDSGSVSAMDEYEGNKMLRIRIRTDLEADTEYFMKMTAVTATGKKIRYFTRVKYTPEDHFSENLEFIQSFHTKLFDKEKKEELRNYLESDATMPNHSLAYVNINSSLDVVTWGELAVKKLTEPIPVLTENNASTTSMQLKYLVEAETDTGTEEYFVTEFYRVQWTQNAMYLLSYERSMEAVYNPANTSLAKSELKLGISAETDLDIVTSGGNTRLCFVKERELWYYNVAENEAIRVFSFREQGSYDKRELYDQHDIQVLKMDDSGNIDFMVYGYMNRGVYEGRVAVVLYRFYAGENRIEEQVYIPLETSYQVLKEDLNRLSYVSSDATFYFSLYNTLYAYNIITKRLESITEDITEETCLVFPDRSRVVWQESSQSEESEKLVMMDLESRKQQEITAKGDTKGKGSGSRVLKLLGGIDENMIYGVANKDEIYRTLDGAVQVPMDKIIIADKEGVIQKDYQKKGVYVFGISVEGNVITLERKSKNGDGWKEEAPDHILNYMPEESEVIGISERVTDRTLTEHYITLPYGYVLERRPTAQETDITIIHDETTLRLAATDNPPKRYYTCIYGEVAGTSLEASAAIAEANEKMGFVINEVNRVVWERGAKKRSAQISVDIISSGKRAQSEEDCIRMVLAQHYLEVDSEELEGIKGGITEVLDHYLGGGAVNLSGASLDEVLYFVSQGCPVIALNRDAASQQNRTVLLTGYDEYNLTWIDPVQGNTVRSSLLAAEESLQQAGNVFVSYIP